MLSRMSSNTSLIWQHYCQLVVMYSVHVCILMNRYYCVSVMAGSTTGLPTTCQNMGTTTSSTGLTTERGTLSAGLWVGR